MIENLYIKVKLKQHKVIEVYIQIKLNNLMLYSPFY